MAEQKKHWWDGMKWEEMTPAEQIARYYRSETPPKPITEEDRREMVQILLDDRIRREREKREEK